VKKRGFTYIEVVFAAAVLAVVFIATLYLLQYHRLQMRTAMERSIMLDFAQQYLETARNKPFFEILPGTALNTLYDGAHGSPDIRFPVDNSWQSLWTTDFRNFHPDLEWFEGRNPEYRCIITDEMVGMNTRSKHINLEVRWKPPFERGAEYISIQLDTLVYQDFN